MFDLWRGPAPPAVKSVVDVIYRPGQAVAAAKVLPNQSTESGFEGIAFTPLGAFGSFTSAHNYADSYRAIIGTVVALTFGGISYGNVLIKDVTVIAVEAVIRNVAVATAVDNLIGAWRTAAPSAAILLLSAPNLTVQTGIANGHTSAADGNSYLIATGTNYLATPAYVNGTHLSEAGQIEYAADNYALIATALGL